MVAVFVGATVLQDLPFIWTSIMVGIAIIVFFGFFSYRSIESTLLANRVKALLHDESATYLMPGAFTHVLVHPELPNDVFLVKRGESAIERFVGKGGPRQSTLGELSIFNLLFRCRLAARTRQVCKLRIQEIRIALGANLQQAAVRGEERFVADKNIDEEVVIQIQERGIPLNEFLAKNQQKRGDVYRQFGQRIHQMWQAGFIDLDIAFRNYMVRLDRDGNVFAGEDEYTIVVHDFGCIFELPDDPDEVAEFIDQKGMVADIGRAAISNGNFLLRSLCGKKEYDFAPFLIPDADWPRLREIFNPQEEGLPLPKRLMHHENYRTLRDAHAALVKSICLVIDEAKA